MNIVMYLSYMITSYDNMDIDVVITSYLDKMLPSGKHYNVYCQSSQRGKSWTHFELLKLADKYPREALEMFFKTNSDITKFKEIMGRIKRKMNSNKFQTIINIFTYNICLHHEYYLACSVHIIDIKMALKGAIDGGCKDTTRMLLREYPEYASMAIRYSLKIIELDIAETACEHDEVFAVSFEIERSICKRIKRLHSDGIEPLWEELSNLHNPPLGAGCLPLRYAAWINNDHVINTLISHEINTKHTDLRNINIDLINTAVAACALFNSIESLWMLITYYYSHPLDKLASMHISCMQHNGLFNIMSARPNKSPLARGLSNKYSQLSKSCLPHMQFVSKLILDVAKVGNYEAWVVLFYYLHDIASANSSTTLSLFRELNLTFNDQHTLLNLIKQLSNVLTREMTIVVMELCADDIPLFDLDAKRCLFKCCIKYNLIADAKKLIEWDINILNTMAYYNQNLINDLILTYARVNDSTNDIVFDVNYCHQQVAKLCLNEVATSRNHDNKLNATLAAICYIIKSNFNAVKQLVANSYCFDIDTKDDKLKSAIEEYGDDQLKALFDIIN
ncbi:Hypothetical protein FSTVST1_38 [Faustovirus ST1]|nr:Hypothetical protein FSTVST1_38 [Faustovirus ST1]